MTVLDPNVQFSERYMSRVCKIDNSREAEHFYADKIIILFAVEQKRDDSLMKETRNGLKNRRNIFRKSFTAPEALHFLGWITLEC